MGMTTETQNQPEILRCDNATLERRKGVYLLHLKGSYEEMGYQHGALALRTTGNAALNYFDTMIESVIAHAVPPLAGFIGALLKNVFHTLNKSRMGAELGDHIRGYASAIGRPPSDLEKIAMVPDILHYLIGVAFPPLAMGPSCSGFMARASATQDGKLLIGRNFDFFGQGVWDAANALIVMEPDQGQKLCWVGALGVPAGPQGINEAGIVISLHTKFNRDVRLTGIPLFSLCARIMQHAETLDDALAIIAEQPRMCGLSLFITDTKAHDAAVCGFSANDMEIIRPENDILVRANHYITDAMKKYEVAPHPWVLHSTARYKRINHLLNEKHGALAPEDIPRILSDRVDPWEGGPERVAGNIVSATNNAQSVAYSPDDDALWLANGTFPVCRSEKFEGFRISALFARDRANYDIPDLPGAPALGADEKIAEYNYQQAWQAHQDNHDDDRALFHLLQAAEALPQEPVFPRLAGITHMKHKRFAQAIPLLERNVELTRGTPLMRAEAHVWLARCLDLAGDHAAAVPHYRAAVELDAPPVSAAARRHIDYPCTTKVLADVSPEYTVGTAVVKY
jgi:tetratricopeptide (TPR) repeat protein